MSTYRPVQSAVRALKVLTLLNRHNNAGLAELCRMSGMPKPSLVRLLETLIADGYVERDPVSGLYRVAARAGGLSGGFHGGPLLVEAGRELCIELTRRLKWPVSIAVLDGTAMFGFFSTVPDSPVAPYRPMFSKPRGLLDSALGRAYLAFCPAAERQILTRMLKCELAESSEEIDAQVEEIVRKARHFGFASRDAIASPLKNASIALPLRFDNRVLGTVGITYFGSAIRRSDILEKIVSPLRETTERIEQNIARIKGSAPADVRDERTESSGSTRAITATLAASAGSKKRLTPLSPGTNDTQMPSPVAVKVASTIDFKMLPDELHVLPQSVVAVIEGLEADIIRRRVLPGTRLLEDSLMTAYKAKRHSVRGALEELERLGVLEKPRSRGATLRQFGGADIACLFETYGLLQCAAVERLRPASPEQIGNIYFWLERYAEAAQAKHLSMLHRANMMFHDAIFSLCRNSFLAKSIRGYDWMTFPISAYSLNDDAVLQQECRQHLEMTELVSKRRLTELRELTLTHASIGRHYYERSLSFGFSESGLISATSIGASKLHDRQFVTKVPSVKQPVLKIVRNGDAPSFRSA